MEYNLLEGRVLSQLCSRMDLEHGEQGRAQSMCLVNVWRRTERCCGFEVGPEHLCRLLWIPPLYFLILLIFSQFFIGDTLSTTFADVSSSFFPPPVSVSSFALSDLNSSGAAASKSFLWPHRLKQDLLAHALATWLSQVINLSHIFGSYPTPSQH